MALNLKMPIRFGSSPSNGEPELGHEGTQLVASLHGKHYEDTMAGRVFSHAPVVAGLAIPVTTATAIVGGMPIWNPSNSRVNVELIKTTIAHTTATGAGVVVVLMARSGLGTDIATGSEITAFAETDPFNGILGGGNNSQVKSSNAGTITVTAGVDAEVVRTLFGQQRPADTGTEEINVADHDFDGTIIVPPGTMVWIAASLATTALFVTTVIWKEIPIR